MPSITPVPVLHATPTTGPLPLGALTRPPATAAPAAPTSHPAAQPAAQPDAAHGVLGLVGAIRRGDGSVDDHPMVPGNRSSLLVDTRQFVPAIVQDIKAAKHHINATMFSWQDDGAGKIIGDLLMAKARQGVDVSVVVDGFGSRQWPLSRYRKYVDQMSESGVNVVRNWRWNNPLMPDDNSGTRAFDHRKIFEIDGRVAYHGGMNLAKKYDEWHDTMVRIEGPAAARAGAEVLGRYVDLGGKVTESHERVLGQSMSTPLEKARGGVRLLGNSPGGKLEATQEFFRMADAAKTRFWVLSPYLGSNEMIDKLVETAQRGVDVRLAVPGPNPWKNGKFALKLTRSFYPELIAGGVKVFEQPQMSHTKLWLSDDTPNISSVNLDTHSAKINYEVGATIDDPHFLKQVESLFARDIGRSRQVDATEAQDYRTFEKVRTTLGLDV